MIYTRKIPLKRSWIKVKKRRRRVLWRSGRIIEDAAGMASLRLEVFRRANGRCEVCGRFAKWQGIGGGELAHIVARGRGGSDTAENLLWKCRGCHRADHPGPQWRIAA